MSESDQPHSRQEELDDPAETILSTPRIAFRLRRATFNQPWLGSSVFVPKLMVLTRL